MRQGTKWDTLQAQAICLTLQALAYHFVHFPLFFSFLLVVFELLIHFLFCIVDRLFTTPNFNLVNHEDLNRILQSEVFLRRDNQLQATYVILEYTSISSSFQSPKYMIKAKDPSLVQFDFVILGFLTSPPPPLKGTHNVALTNQQIAEILQAEDEVIPSDEEQEEPIQEPKPANLEEDFSIFDQPKFVESSSASSRHQSVIRVSND